MNTARILSFFLFLCLITPYIIINVNAAPVINDVVPIVGVIDTILHFNTTNAGDTTYINVSVNADMTSNWSTYTDPTDLLGLSTYGSGGQTERWMIIRNLTEDTTYYYTINRNGACDATGSFTTLPRYTNETGWGDEFLDTYLVDAMNVSISQLPGKKHPNNPVNATLDADSFGLLHEKLFMDASVVFANGTYHCWSSTKYLHKVLYASDPNGTTFNMSWSVADTIRANASIGREWDVAFDPTTGYYVAIANRPSDEKRFALWDSIGNESRMENMVEIWNPGSHELESHGLSYDPLSASRIFGTAIHHNPGGGYSTAPRYGHWYYLIPNGTDYSKWIFIEESKLHKDYTYCMGFFEELLPFNDGFYSSCIQTRNQMYIGLVGALANETDADGMPHYLIHSRDNYDWEIYNTTNMILNSTDDFDKGMIRDLGTGGVMYTHDDEDWIYYGGFDIIHGGDPTELGMGIIKWRHQGFTYVKPTTTQGWLRTVNISRNFAKNFTVNGNFTATAKLDISILNTSTNMPFTGFSLADFTTITTNSTSISCSWGSKTIEAIPDENFKINFSWDGVGSGELYSYSLDGFGEFGENLAPVFSDYWPANEATGITFDPVIYGSISDPEGDTLNGNLRTNASGAWQDIGSFGLVGNCTVNCNTGPYDVFQTLSTKYWWSMNLSDGTTWVNTTYTFTTRGNTLPVISDISPANKTVGWSVSGTKLYFTLSDANGDYMPYNTTTNISATFSQSSLWIENGTYYLQLSTLEPNTNYTWWINVTDYHHPASTGFIFGYTNESYWFVTGVASTGLDFDGMNAAATVLFIAIAAIFSLSAIIAIIGKWKW